MKKYIAFVVLATLALMSGCADPAALHESVTDDPAGFWFGLWNGFTIVFAFIGSLFWDDIAIYAVNNKGGLYDFGFVLGASLWLGASNR